MNNIVKQVLTMMAGALVLLAGLAVYAASAQDQVIVAPLSSGPTMIETEAGFPSPAAFQYQGQLLNPSTGAPVPNAALPMTFRLYSEPAGPIANSLWGEQLSVQVTDGIFTARLGAQAANPLPQQIFDGRNLYLGIAVGGNADDEATPRQPLATVPFAMNARFLDGATGSDFVPVKRGAIAYGIVNESCGREKGYRFSSNTGANGNECNITLKDANDNSINYNLNDFVTQVTVVENSSCPGPSIATTGSGSGNLIIDMYDHNGSGRRCKFHFVTFQP